MNANNSRPNMWLRHAHRACGALMSEDDWTFKGLKVPHCAFIVIHIFVNGA